MASLIIAQKTRNKHPLFWPQAQETGISCRLGPDRMRTISTSKSQIVGIPPFPDCMRNAGHDGTYPFFSPNLEETSVSSGWGRGGHGPFRHQNRKSLENGRFRIVQETRNAMKQALFRPQPRKNGPILSVGAGRGVRSWCSADSGPSGVPPIRARGLCGMRRLLSRAFRRDRVFHRRRTVKRAETRASQCVPAHNPTPYKPCRMVNKKSRKPTNVKVSGLLSGTPRGIRTHNPRLKRTLL